MKAEKIEFFNSEEKKLVGVLHLPKEKTEKVIIMAHGFTSNKDRIRSIEIANKLCKNGFSVLRFDFGGSGESYESEILIRKQIDDLESAIKFVKRKKYKKIGLLGESLGGLIALKAYNPGIKTMVLFAPVTASKPPSYFRDTFLFENSPEIKDEGYAFLKKDGRIFKIPEEYVRERESVNQRELLSRVKCPVLIIHGTEDDSVPLKDSKKSLKYLSKESKLKIIGGAGHKLDIIHGIDDLSLEWFKKYLK